MRALPYPIPSAVAAYIPAAPCVTNTMRKQAKPETMEKKQGKRTAPPGTGGGRFQQIRLEEANTKTVYIDVPENGYKCFNGNVVPKEMMKKAVDEFKHGLLDHPSVGYFSCGSRNLEDASHIVEDVAFENGRILVKIAFIETPRGNVCRNLIDVPGVKFEPTMAVSRHMDENGVTVVDRIHEIRSIDMVFREVGKTNIKP